MSNANIANIISVMGSTGTGKTQWLMRRIAKPKRKRILVWSPKEPIDRYAQRIGGHLVTTTEEMRQRLIAAKGGPICLVFRPPAGRKLATPLFDAFCRLARAAGNLTVIAEEIHTVTLPSAAPDGWSELTMMGRGYGCEVYGLSQRPASVDKDFFGNCTLHHCGRLGYEEDAKVMAKLLGVQPADLLALPDLHYIERERPPAPAKRGVLRF